MLHLCDPSQMRQQRLQRSDLAIVERIGADILEKAEHCIMPIVAKHAHARQVAEAGRDEIVVVELVAAHEVFVVHAVTKEELADRQILSQLAARIDRAVIVAIKLVGSRSNARAHLAH